MSILGFDEIKVTGGLKSPSELGLVDFGASGLSYLPDIKPQELAG